MLPKLNQKVRFSRRFFWEQLQILKSIRWELLGYKAEKQKLIIFKGTVINESGEDIMVMKSKSFIWFLPIHTASQAGNLSFIQLVLLIFQTVSQI